LNQVQHIEIRAVGADVALPEVTGDRVRRMIAEGQGEGRHALPVRVTQKAKKTAIGGFF